MTRRFFLSFWLSFLTVALLVAVSAGCGKKKERTRDDDRQVIKQMLAEIEKPTVERNPDGFDEYIILSFDAQAFIDTVWSEFDADQISFRIIRTKIWPDEARAVIEVSYTLGDQALGKRYYGFDLIYRDEKWKFSAFDVAGESPF